MHCAEAYGDFVDLITLWLFCLAIPFGIASADELKLGSPLVDGDNTFIITKELPIPEKPANAREVSIDEFPALKEWSEITGTPIQFIWVYDDAKVPDDITLLSLPPKNGTVGVGPMSRSFSGITSHVSAMYDFWYDPDPNSERVYVRQTSVSYWFTRSNTSQTVGTYVETRAGGPAWDGSSTFITSYPWVQNGNKSFMTWRSDRPLETHKWTWYGTFTNWYPIWPAGVGEGYTQAVFDVYHGSNKVYSDAKNTLNWPIVPKPK